MEQGDNLYRIRHSFAHVLAQAVKKFYPDVQLGFGPPTDDGFYYDFDLGGASLVAKDLKRIEREMKKIISQNQSFTRVEVDHRAALARLPQESYKREQVDSLHAEGVEIFSFYENKTFSDLCEGPHVAQTGDLPVDAFKLDRIAGAYWLGDETRTMLTRIYGFAFDDAEQLTRFLERRAYAEKFDHKKLGRELELFTFADEVGRGLPLWLPNGTVIRDAIEDFAKEVEFRYGYQRVSTPHIAKSDLYYRSQHLPAYQESMFPPLTTPDSKDEYYLRPMTCPHHHLVYASRKRSYRELPLRLAEYATLYRYEQSGELSGLLRVRYMTLNDAHIYLRASQLREEFKRTIAMHREFYEKFQLEKYRIRLSLRDDTEGENKNKYAGDREMWNDAERLLQEVCDECEIEYFVARGEAAFYGPKVDYQFKNLMGREETLSTIQLDFLSPRNFELTYTDEHDNAEMPLVIHRAPLSTHERFVSHLIEHYGGAMPSWCAPLQVMLVPVSNVFLKYAEDVQERLRTKMVRVKVDDSTNSFGKKIRQCAVQKIPFQLIIGEKEANTEQVTIRRHGLQEQTTVPVAEAIAVIVAEIEERADPRRPQMAEFY